MVYTWVGEWRRGLIWAFDCFLIPWHPWLLYWFILFIGSQGMALLVVISIKLRLLPFSFCLSFPLLIALSILNVSYDPSYYSCDSSENPCHAMASTTFTTIANNTDKEVKATDSNRFLDCQRATTVSAASISFMLVSANLIYDNNGEVTNYGSKKLLNNSRNTLWVTWYYSAIFVTILDDSQISNLQVARVLVILCPYFLCSSISCNFAK